MKNKTPHPPEFQDLRISVWEDGELCVTGIRTCNTDEDGRTRYCVELDDKERRIVRAFKSRLIDD